MSCYPHQNDDRYIYARYGLARRTIGAHNTDIMIRIVGILGQIVRNQDAHDYPRYPNGLCIPTFKSQVRNIFYAIDVQDNKGRYSSRYLRSLNYVLDFIFMDKLWMAVSGAMYTPFTWFVINAMNTKGADTWLLTMMSIPPPFAFKLVSKNRDRKSYGMFADVINGFSRDSIDVSWLSSWMHDHGDMANCDFRSICDDCRDSIYGSLPALYGFMEIYAILASYTRDNMTSAPELNAFSAVLLEDLISMIASGVSDEAIHESLMINYA